ncbi:MAG: hypothetical protein JST80_13245 [Bdellovibrionales bacterium]|nr:hypothetical protein [Bdellovibrionales bacterium]
MLKQASVSDLISERVNRDIGYVTIIMRRYPRFINRALRDEYLPCLSPDRKLFGNLISAKRRYKDHNGAFERVHFDERFTIDHEGMEALGRLVRVARKKDVYLVCQCQIGKHCHREMVLLLAKKLFKDSKVENPRNTYPKFLKRLKDFKKLYRETFIVKPNTAKKSKQTRAKAN